MSQLIKSTAIFVSNFIFQCICVFNLSLTIITIILTATTSIFLLYVVVHYPLHVVIIYDLTNKHNDDETLCKVAYRFFRVVGTLRGLGLLPPHGVHKLSQKLTNMFLKIMHKSFIYWAFYFYYLCTKTLYNFSRGGVAHACGRPWLYDNTMLVQTTSDV